jgi:hypothetical protein
MPPLEQIPFDFSKPIGKAIEPPKNQKALALYLLLEAGKRGVNNLEAVKSSNFWKFNTRTSDLINDYGVEIHKKNEPFTNRFNHAGSTTRYCLYDNQLEKNLEIYNRINT